MEDDLDVSCAAWFSSEAFFMKEISSSRFSPLRMTFIEDKDDYLFHHEDIIRLAEGTSHTTLRSSLRETDWFSDDFVLKLMDLIEEETRPLFASIDNPVVSSSEPMSNSKNGHSRQDYQWPDDDSFFTSPEG